MIGGGICRNQAEHISLSKGVRTGMSVLKNGVSLYSISLAVSGGRGMGFRFSYSRINIIFIFCNAGARPFHCNGKHVVAAFSNCNFTRFVDDFIS